MPKVKITREMVLEAALGLIIREGHESVTIKTVAKELNCSTQPISWSFGNMDNFRTALFDYALDYANRKMYSDSDNVMEEYGSTGAAYITMAYEEPNLIIFLRSDEKRLQNLGGFGCSFNEEASKKRRELFKNQYGCSEQDAERFMQNVLIYTQGLVSMILTNGLNVGREGAILMLENLGKDLMLAYTQKNRG